LQFLAVELFTDGIASGMTVAALAARIDRHRAAKVIPDEDSVEPPCSFSLAVIGERVGARTIANA
jgi:hypothetical protein